MAGSSARNIGGDHIGHIDVHSRIRNYRHRFVTLGDGTLAGMLADGYGIRDALLYRRCVSIGSIVAAGNGQNVSTQTYSPDVRLSEVEQRSIRSPASSPISSPTSIFVTGATAQVPQVAAGFNGGLGTDTGVIAGLRLHRKSRPSAAFRPTRFALDPPRLPPQSLTFANNIGSITTTSNDDGLSVITGKLQSFHPGGNIDHLTFQIAGPIQKLTLNGDVTSNSIISASGRNGNIGTLRVGGTMQGSITASRRIASATIGGNLSGTISAKQINVLKVVGSLTGGNLDIEGNVNSIHFLGDLGLPDETLTIHGSVNSIKIGGNLNADISVEGNLGTLLVGQSVITGTLTDIDGNLNFLTVDGDVQSGATIQAALIRHQKIKGLNQGTLNGLSG